MAEGGDTGYDGFIDPYRFDLCEEQEEDLFADVNPTVCWSSWEKGHGEQMRDLLETGFLSDATLILGPEKKRVQVHQLLLRKGSAIFNTKFQDAAGTELILEDVDPKMFMMLLQYLYTGESGAAIGVALGVLQLATDYAVTGLADQCAKMLTGALTNENVIDLFQQAVKYGRQELVKSAANYICTNAHAIVESEEFKDMQHDRLMEILGRNDLMVKSEIQLFEALVKWGGAECSRQNLELSDLSIRKVLDNLIGLVRFPLMDREEFTLKVALKNLLKMEELISILLYFNVSDGKRSSIPPGRFNSSKRNYYIELKYDSAGRLLCTKCGFIDDTAYNRQHRGYGGYCKCP